MVMENIELLGIKITPGTLEEICQEIGFLAGQKRKSFIIDANVHGINLALQLPWLAELYHRADLVYVDGAGVVLGARLLGYHIPPRQTMADLGWPAVAHLVEKERSLYLLGNPQGVAAQAAERLKAAMPGVRILGTHHGLFQKTGPENDAVIAEINHLQPDVLMVGLGMPMEQRWILDNYARVDTRVFWTVGAAFQYWAGVIPRCPRWMGEHGLEWLFRLLLEPRRMAKRYLWGNAVFLIKVLQERQRLAWAAEHPARLAARILSPPEAVFKLLPVQPGPLSPHPRGQAENRGVSKLAIHLQELQDLLLAVDLTDRGIKARVLGDEDHPTDSMVLRINPHGGPAVPLKKDR